MSKICVLELQLEYLGVSEELYSDCVLDVLSQQNKENEITMSISTVLVSRLMAYHKTISR